MHDQPLPSTPSFDLTVLTSATYDLKKATTIDEIQDVRNVAEVARSLAKNAHMGLETQDKTAELKQKAERKAGEFLASLNLRGGDRVSNGHGNRLLLRDLGISQNQSKRWQKEASLPESEFRAYIEHANCEELEVSSAALLRLAQQHDGSSTERPSYKRVKLKTVPDDLENNTALTLDPHELDDLRQTVAELKGHGESLSNVLGHAPSCEAVNDSKMRLMHRYLREIDQAIRRLDGLFQ